MTERGDACPSSRRIQPPTTLTRASPLFSLAANALCCKQGRKCTFVSSPAKNVTGWPARSPARKVHKTGRGEESTDIVRLPCADFHAPANRPAEESCAPRPRCADRTEGRPPAIERQSGIKISHRIQASEIGTGMYGGLERMASNGPAALRRDHPAGKRTPQPHQAPRLSRRHQSAAGDIHRHPPRLAQFSSKLSKIAPNPCRDREGAVPTAPHASASLPPAIRFRRGSRTSGHQKIAAVETAASGDACERLAGTSADKRRTKPLGCLADLAIRVQHNLAGSVPRISASSSRAMKRKSSKPLRGGHWPAHPAPRSAHIGRKTRSRRLVPEPAAPDAR